MAFPGLGAQDLFRVLAQVGVALLEHLDEFRLVLAGRARAIADHALHHLLPLFLAALAAHKEAALLVAEAALLHGGFLQRFVATEIQRGEPGIGRLLSGQRGRIGLGGEAQLKDGIGANAGPGQVLIARHAHAQIQRHGFRVVDLHAAIRAGEGGDLRTDALLGTLARIAVVVTGGAQRALGLEGQHGQRQGRAGGITDADLQRLGRQGDGSEGEGNNGITHAELPGHRERR